MDINIARFIASSPTVVGVKRLRIKELSMPVAYALVFENFPGAIVISVDPSDDTVLLELVESFDGRGYEIAGRLSEVMSGTCLSNASFLLNMQGYKDGVEFFSEHPAGEEREASNMIFRFTAGASMIFFSYASLAEV